MKLSIIIPTYNEQISVQELVQYVQSVSYPVDYEIIIIDDASIDRTMEKLEKIHEEGKKEKGKIRIFRNKINRGKGYSIRKGIRRSRGEIIIVQDADREYDPHDIPNMIQPILEGREKVVYGSRFLNTGWPKEMAFKNWLANRFLTFFTNVLFGLKLTDMETCYKAFRSDVLKGLHLTANRFTFEPEVTGLLARQEVSICEVPIDYSGRSHEAGKKIKAVDFFYAIVMLLITRFRKIN